MNIRLLPPNGRRLSLFAALLAGLALAGCGRRESLPGAEPPPLLAFGDALREALAGLPPDPIRLDGPLPAALRKAADEAFSGNFALEGPARALLASSWPGSAAALAGLLVDETVRGPKRAEVLRFAATLGGRGMAALCRHALEGRPDQAVEPRRLAVWLLGESGEEEDVPVLLLRLKYEENEDPAALVGAARSLARHRNLAGVAFLAACLSDPSLRAQMAAQLAEICGWEEIGVGEEPPQQARLLMQTWLAEGRSRRDGRSEPNPALVRGLLARLDRCREFNLRFRDDAVFILERAGWQACAALAAGLREANVDIRVATVEILRSLGPVGRPLGPLLAGLLRDPLTGLYAVEALGTTGWLAGAPFLLRLAGSPAPDLRQATLLALGRMGAKSALPLLEAALADTARAPEEHLAAALSLGLLGDRTRAQTLLEGMSRRPDVHQETLRQHLEELERQRP